MAEISPTIPQHKYIQTQARFPAFVAGFGAGKTEAAVLRSVIGLLNNPGCNRGFYEPTYDLIRMIAFPRFEAVLNDLGLAYTLVKSPSNYIDLHGYGNIYFRSMDNPSRIVGYEHADADVDELDTLKKDDAAYVWRQILARNRQKKPNGQSNTIGVTTTPEGFRFVYEAWKKNPRDGYELIKAPTYSNPHLPDGYIDSLREAYPSNLLNAYIEGEFVNLASGSVYINYDRSLNDCKIEPNQSETLHIGMDFNVNNMSAAIHVMRNSNAYAVDEIIGAQDTPAVIKMIRNRYPDNPVIVYPDASGGSTNTTNAGTSDIILLKNANFSVNAPRANGRVRDRVSAVNMALCNNDGQRLYYVNIDKCPNIALGLEQQAYDKNGEPDKKAGFDHLNDAIGYFVVRKMPIKRRIEFVEQPTRWT